MIILALFLIVIAVIDGIAGTKRPGLRQPGSLALIIALAAIAAGLGHLLYHDKSISLVILLTLTAGCTLWLRLRNGSAGKHGWFAIAALALMLATAGLMIPALVPPPTAQNSPLVQHLGTYLANLPWPQLQMLEPGPALLIPALLLFLGPTANALVRTIMTRIRNVDYEASARQLKGGRYIGPLERWLIFGLAIAGEPTAAALVISAKSIIRFPELQSKAVRPTPVASPTAPAEAPSQVIDELTEYFLIGSLLSWLLALGAAVPISSLAAAG